MPDRSLAFFQKIEELLSLRQEFKTKNNIIPRFKKIDEYRSDFHTLNALLKHFL